MSNENKQQNMSSNENKQQNLPGNGNKQQNLSAFDVLYDELLQFATLRAKDEAAEDDYVKMAQHLELFEKNTVPEAVKATEEYVHAALPDFHKYLLPEEMTPYDQWLEILHDRNLRVRNIMNYVENIELDLWDTRRFYDMQQAERQAHEEQLEDPKSSDRTNMI